MISFTPRLFVAALILGGFVFSGCGSTSGTSITEKGIRSTNEQTGESVALGDDVMIPATFPADLPRYPGARTQVAIYDAQATSYTVNQQTGDSVTQIKAWAEQTMTANGFAKTNELVDATTAVLWFEKGAVRYQVQAMRDEARSLTYIITARVGS